MAEHQTYRFCPRCGTALHVIERHGAQRPVCPNCDYTVYYDPKVAVVMRVTSGPSVLLIKRGVDPEKGKWALPAGFVNAGEPPAEAAVREIQEETGIVVPGVNLLDVFSNPGDGTADIIIAYGVELKAHGPTHAADDAEEAAFFRADNLPPTAFKTTEWLLARWQPPL